MIPPAPTVIELFVNVTQLLSVLADPFQPKPNWFTLTGLLIVTTFVPVVVQMYALFVLLPGQVAGVVPFKVQKALESHVPLPG
jgi:hypothetical protein